jgi:hypothetical protein
MSAAATPNNPNSGTGNTPKDYWTITVAIPFLDRMIEELSERFSPATRAHYELCQKLFLMPIIKLYSTNGNM